MKNILIAEDEIIISMALKMSLEQNNYSIVTIVSSGEDLISQYHLKKPDLIITDLRLQGKISGLEAVSEIRKTDNTPVLIITGSTYSKAKTIAKRISNCHILEKPFKQSEVIYYADKFCKQNL